MNPIYQSPKNQKQITLITLFLLKLMRLWLFGLFALFASSSYAMAGAISGTVTDKVGNPIEGINISALDVSSGAGGYNVTDANGKYTISNLPVGEYRIEFYDYSKGFASEYFDNASYDNPTLITLAEDETKIADAKLDKKSMVHGKVTDINGNPIKDVQVSAQYYDAYGSWFPVSDVFTNDNGEYIFSDFNSLDAGTYRFRFQSNSQGFEYYNDATTIDGAQDVVIANNEDRIIDVVLGDLPSGTITGTVTDNAGNPIEGVYIYFSLKVGNNWENGGGSSTNANGKYTISNLPVGEYRISFNGSMGFISEVYDNASYDNPTLITLAEDETKIADAKLDKKGVVHGKVTDINGNPVEGVWVSAQYYDAYGSWFPASDVFTNENGEYSFSDFNGLDAGTYRFKFQSNSQGFEYYKDATTIEYAQDVVIANYEDKTINIILGAPDEVDSLAGIVKDSNGSFLANVSVKAYQSNDGDWSGIGEDDFITEIFTDNNGSYTFKDLADGTYRIRFDATTVASRLAAKNGKTLSYLGSIIEYYKDASSLVKATDIIVTSGQVTSINDVIIGAPDNKLGVEVQAIPTLQQWVIVLLIILLFMISWWQSKVRKQQYL